MNPSGNVIAAMFLLTVLICAAFTVVAGLVVILIIQPGLPDEPGFVTRLLVKTVLFAVLAVAAGVGLWRLRSPTRMRPTPTQTTPRGGWITLLPRPSNAWRRRSWTPTRPAAAFRYAA